MKRQILTALLVLTALAAQAVDLTTTYAENFNSMGTSGTTPPAGWTIRGALGGASTTWTTTIPAAGLPNGTQSTTLVAATTYAATSNTNGYNYALPASTADRALGASPTTGSGIGVQLSLTNTSGGALTTFQIAYDIRRFSTSAAANQLPGYWFFYSLDNGTTWTNVAALNSNSTTVPNTTGVTTVANTVVTLGSNWASSSNLLLRWMDDNAETYSPDQIYGLDNVVVTAGSNALPTVTLTSPTAGAAAVVSSGSYTLTANAADSDGSITQVEFLRNGVVINTDTTAPYNFADTGYAAGVLSYTARATDNTSAVTTSAAVIVSAVTDPAKTALYFDGVNDYVTMGTAAALNAGGPPNNGFTLECWFRKEGTGVVSSSGGGGVSAVPLFGKGRGEGENSNIDCNYFFGVTTGGLLVADFEAYPASGITAGQNYPVTAANTPIVNNQWYHAAVSYDGPTTTWKVYLDGAQVGTATAAANALPRYDSIQHFGVGAAFNSTGVPEGAFAGRMDEVRVWNYARSAAEIAAAKDTEIATATGLIGRYGVNEGTGTTTANTPGTAGAPVGTLTNGPLWVDGAPFVSNTAPTVTLTSPTVAYNGMAPALVSFAADAADSDGTITKVEFFQGTTKVGEDTTGPSPYTFDWTAVAMGTYSLTARATDNNGATATSTAVSITVMPNSNQPPVITLTAPANNATGIGSSTTISASIADPEGDAQTVTFYGRQTTPATPGADFTVATLPDTQFYSENLNNNGRSATYFAQTQWLFDNRNSVAMPNLAFVSHMGDIVQNGDAVPAEWLVPDGAMKTIENPATSLRAYGIPYGVTLGNHDYGTGGGTGSTTGYNQYFGTARFAGRNYYGGNYGTNNNNSYQLFSASGLDFIGISFEYLTGAQSTWQPLLDWADALLKAHPNRRAIITTHWMVETGNPAAFSGQGQIIYNELKDNPNLFLMLGGHVAGEGRRSDTFEGRTVYSVLQDYQGRTNGGDGWLRYFIFSPANNTITAKTYRVSNPVNPAAGTYETDADSEFTLNYNMQNSPTDWIPLGTVNVAAGGATANLNWTGLEAGKNFEWYATANDSINTATSSTRRFTTAANAAPTVALTAPANNASFTSPAGFTLTADAADADGSIARVEFYRGGTKLGEDTSAPYEQSVSSLLVGSYSFTAVAVDNNAQATLSAVVNVTVNASVPPTVAITAPTNGASFDALATINLTADAADADGTVTLVEFFNGATKLGEDSTAPYTFAWTGVITGSYSLTAKATDNANTTATSAAVAFSVTNVDNVAPTVAITAPSSGSSAAPGVPLVLTATAGDTDGIISKVEFFDGTTLLGEDTSAPYSFTVAALATGAHTFTAKATDNDAGTTTSSVINVTGDPALWAYAQNFDSMGTAGTTLPSGWSMRIGTTSTSGNAVWTDSNGILTAGVATLAANANALTAITTPAANNNNGYNAAASAGNTSNRVLATAPTTFEGVAAQLSLTNGSGAALSAIRIGYDIIRYTAVGTANELPGYWLFYSLDNGTTWTNASALNPTLANVPNTAGTTTIAATTLSLSGTWAAGATILFRWVDDNAAATSPDQIIGLDNVAISVPIGQPPVATLTAPAGGTVFYVGDTISLTADASDSDGTITKVEFYQGSTKLGEDTSAPYAYDWTGFTAAAYSLTARATDNDGNITASSAANITVNAAPGSGTLARGPYLNQANQNSIVIRWRTTQSVVGRVRYGTASGSLTQFTDESSAKTNHEVKLTGLTPYTRYYYSVGSSFDTLTPEAADTTSVTTGAYTIPTPTAADYTFRTAPVPGTATDTRIWIVGDCGRGSATQAAGRDAYYNWMGSRVPDLNLQLGDNAYNSGTDTEYQSGYFRMYPTIFRKMPQWSTLGNHDANNTTPSGVGAPYSYPYFDMFTFPAAGEAGGVASGTEHYYSFDYGNIHFICLDSNSSVRTVDNPTTTGVNEDGPMAAWLRLDIASTTKTWIIAFFHHPPYSKGSHDSDTEGPMVEMRTNFNPILEAGGVDLVLTGHSHNYERSVLLNGNYGTTGTITPAMKKNAGNGSTTGFTTSATGKIRNAANSFTATATVNGAVIPADGAYIKPLLGSRANFGAVYNTAGMSGQADGGSLDHSAMYISYSQVGTVNLDINGNTLVATFIQSDGSAPDNYTIIKQGGSTAPIVTTAPATSIGATTATLNASINPTGTQSTAKFQVGASTSYGTDTTVTLTPNDDVISQVVSLNLTGLTPGTTYHYRASATNTNGTTNGADTTFTTLRNDANLAALTISTGSFSPTFAAGTTSYTANVVNAVNSVSVTPTVADATATVQVRVNGGTYASVTSGSASADLALNVNANPIDVKVTAQDGTIKTYTITITRASLFTEWAPLQSLSPAAAAPTADADGDGVANVVEFAFGLNPTSTDSTPLTVTAGGDITARGTPVTTVASTPTAVDFRAAHVRRKDATAAGLTYTVQFSAGDGSWTSSTVTPTVVASDSEVEVVTVKYPLFLNGKKARFFRVVVTAP